MNRTSATSVWSTLALSLAVLLTVSGKAVRAQTLQEEGFWGMLMMEGALGSQTSGASKYRWWLDVQPRFLDNVSGIQQGLFRPGVGYELGEKTTMWVGYARVRTQRSGTSASHEDRIWQQLLWKPRIGELGFQSRTRLEQRFLDTGSDTGWRFRQFVKVSWDLPQSPDFGLVAYDEAFFNLNNTGWGQRQGFTQNRLFAGLAMRLGDGGRMKMEVGYLNQFLDGASSDRMNHILSINLFVNF